MGEYVTCPDCFGKGEEVICCDDICAGQGWCMHGDGMGICPTCHGEGEIYERDPDEPEGGWDV